MNIVIDKKLAIFLLVTFTLGLFGCLFLTVQFTEIFKAENTLTEINSNRSKEEIIALRNLHSVEVLGWELDGSLVNDDPFKSYDIVYLKITNNSTEELPYLTLKTSRYNALGELQGWARSPSLYLFGLKPGETREYTFKPLGSFYDKDFIALVGEEEGITTRITVEVEPFIENEDMQFFEEMEHLVSSP